MKKEVQASVKDERLITKRRNEMIRGAVQLFIEKGFHRTTTREIARASGFSIGTLYEYIRTKEDVLYLVCDRIYDEVRERMEAAIDREKVSLETFKLAIAYYFRVVDEMQAEVLVMYQEAKSLSNDALPYVINKELEMVAMFEQLIGRCVDGGLFELTPNAVKLMAHNIFVQGQMWAFRRWALQKLYTLDDYIALQTELIFAGVNLKGEPQ